MQSITANYQAEVDYRREQVAREFRPSRARRAARVAARTLTPRRSHAA